MWWGASNADLDLRASVPECAGPPALWEWSPCESGGGLPHSGTLARAARATIFVLVPRLRPGNAIVFEAPAS